VSLIPGKSDSPLSSFRMDTSIFLVDKVGADLNFGDDINTTNTDRDRNELSNADPSNHRDN